MAGIISAVQFVVLLAFGGSDDPRQPIATHQEAPTAEEFLTFPSGPNASGITITRTGSHQ